MVKIGRRKKASRGPLIVKIVLALLLLSLLLCMTLFSQMIDTNRIASNSSIITPKETSRQKYIKALPEGEDLSKLYKYHPPTYETNGDTKLDCGSAPSYEKFFALDYHDRSRYNEDKKIYNRFFAKHLADENFVGTYIELGAFDGVKEANTRFYDSCLGWEGLLIEGNPPMYDKVVQNRPSTHRLSYAPSCTNEGETVEFFDVQLTNAGMTGHALEFKNKKKIPVPCGPLSPVLERMFPGGHISFFSLDVEGAEKLVLDTIDFDKIRIDVFMIEVENSMCKIDEDCEVRELVRKKMKDLGYKRKLNVVQVSDVYVHPDSPYVNE